MKIILRNMKATGYVTLDFAGYDVIPNNTSIEAKKSQVVETSMPIIEFRKIADVSTELGAGNLTISHSGGVRNLN